ncbi:MAG: hypothetical protein ACYS8W_16475 [Planctomycetota bacterium]
MKKALFTGKPRQGDGTMKNSINILVFAAVLGLVFAFNGCAKSHKSDRDSAPDYGSTTPTGTTTTPNSTGTSSGTPASGNALEVATDPGDMAADNYVIAVSSTDEMFQWLMKCRQDYASHGRNPDPGAGYPITFTRDSGLDSQAQARAEELAGGGSPEGSRKAFMLDSIHPGEDIYCQDGGDYKIEALSHPDSAANATTGGASGKWHDKGNSAYRMYFCYYDGTGARMSKLGIGAAEVGDGSVWWVLQFGQ